MRFLTWDGWSGWMEDNPGPFNIDTCFRVDRQGNLERLKKSWLDLP